MASGGQFGAYLAMAWSTEISGEGSVPGTGMATSICPVN
jgi:hypothetical protein